MCGEGVLVLRGFCSDHVKGLYSTSWKDITKSLPLAGEGVRRGAKKVNVIK